MRDVPGIRTDEHFAVEFLYRDSELAVIDKPSGVSMLRDRSGAPDLWSAIVALLTREGRKPHLVHRLDKGTSGALMVALTVATQKHLVRALREGRVGKFYVARCVDHPQIDGTAEVDLPLTPGRKSRYRVAGERRHIVLQRPGGRARWTLPREKLFRDRAAHAAVTRFRIVNAERNLMSVRPLTGRTHQIRVHLAWIGHPILGDHLYGAPRERAQQWPRLALHCHRLVIPMRDGTRLGVHAPLPSGLLKIA